MRAEQPRLQQRQRRPARAKREPVDRAGRRTSGVAEQRQRRDADDADRPARQALPVQDDQRDDLADAERGDRDVVAAQPERREDQQRCRAPP